MLVLGGGSRRSDIRAINSPENSGNQDYGND
jgi:hypothetical protein